MKDFFISYTQNDKKWAVWIAGILEDAGYDVLIQDWDFLPGQNFVDKMQKGVTECLQTIAVLSEDYVHSEFARAEWAAVFTRDPTGRFRTLVPVRVMKYRPEGLFASVVYIDIVGIQDEAEARARILNGLGPRLKPSTSPVFPAQGKTRKRAASEFPGPVSGNGPIAQDSPQRIESVKATKSIRAGSVSSIRTRYHFDKNFLTKKCNRHEQIASLRSAIKSHLLNSPNRPLLCITDGDHRECHSEFFDKASEEIVPELLRVFYNESELPPCDHWEIQTKWRDYDNANLARTLENDLKNYSFRSGSAYEQIVTSRLRGLSITFIIYTEDYRHLGLVDFLSDYWSEIDNLPSGMLLIINLSFRYRPGYRFLQKYDHKWKNRRLRLKARQLGSRQSSKANFVLLGELLAVHHRDARRLIFDVEESYSLTVSDVDKLYSNPKLCTEGETMHMSELVAALEKIHGEQSRYSRW